MQISDELFDKIRQWLEKAPNPEVYRDRNDKFDLDIVCKYINEKGGDINDLYEYADVDTWEIEIEHIEKCLEEFDDSVIDEFGKYCDFNKFAIDLRDDVIEYFNVDDNDLSKCIPDIPVRLELMSNYDCINSHWLESESDGYTHRDSYFADTMRALGIQPSDMFDIFQEHDLEVKGKWPLAPKRECLVDLKKFYTEIENRSCGANVLTIIGTMDGEKLLSADRNKMTLEVPAGNMVGFYSSMQGGGSVFECELLKPLKIKIGKGERFPYWRLETDTKDNGYTIKKCYGVSDSFFDGEIKIIKNG